MNLAELDRQIQNIVSRKPSRFEVNLCDCIDEFGNSFGVGGTHFFVSGLAESKTADELKSFLGNYYNSNPIRSFNEVVGRDIGNVLGEQYFCPWEAGRVRPLSKFLNSHKVGPTPESALENIAVRLNAVLKSIRENGFQQAVFRGSVPRVIELCSRDGRRKYIIRDGQHRCAVLSHLGHKRISVCYEADYWKPSRIFLKLHRQFGRSKWVENTTPRIVRESDAANWPHVLQNTVTVSDAELFFADVFHRPSVPES